MTLEERVEEYIEKNCKIWEEGELTVDEIVRLAIIGFTKELQEENGKLLQRIAQLEKDVTENESDCLMCDFPKLKQDLEKENKQLKQQIKYWKAEYEKLFNED